MVLGPPEGMSSVTNGSVQAMTVTCLMTLKKHRVETRKTPKRTPEYVGDIIVPSKIRKTFLSQ